MGERYFHGFEPGVAERLLHSSIIPVAVPGQPAIRELHDAVAIPAAPALYDTEGRRIDAAAVRTVSPDAPPVRHQKLHKGAPGQISLPTDLDVVEEPVLLGGHLMKHYGHFIFESMSRLWARDLFPALPIIFTSPGKWRIPPSYGTDVIEALGLSQRLVNVARPTLFRNVICPGTAFEYRWRAFAVAVEPHVAAANALAARSSRQWRRPAYLTRSGLSDDLRKSEEEPELETALSDRGFDIVRPEELPLAEQIALLKQAPLIVSTVGSALHTALFSRSAGTLATLNWGRGFEHYMLVDAVKDHRSYYIKSMERGEKENEHRLNVERTLLLLEEAGLLERRIHMAVAG